MTGAGVQDLEEAVLYARVSTAGQVRHGYSLGQQLEALRAHAERAGYRVIEEVLDAAQSGATLNRPGLDRVRDLVAAGGVAVLLVQDLDRLAREPEHYRLLRSEFRKGGCEVVVLNYHGGTPDAHLARREVDMFVERSMRGKLRKAREGKILAGTSANYGFRFNAMRNGYEVDRSTMEVVGRIFRMLGVERRSLHAVKRTLEAEEVPTPAGGRRWSTWVIRRFVLDDVYRPHSLREIEALVAGDVAAELDPDRRYGIWWFNRERWTVARDRFLSAPPPHECDDRLGPLQFGPGAFADRLGGDPTRPGEITGDELRPQLWLPLPDGAQNVPGEPPAKHARTLLRAV